MIHDIIVIICLCVCIIPLGYHMIYDCKNFCFILFSISRVCHSWHTGEAQEMLYF